MFIKLLVKIEHYHFHYHMMKFEVNESKGYEDSTCSYRVSIEIEKVGD